MGCKPTLPPPQIDPCLVKPTCFFWGGVSRWGRRGRARWPGLACDSSEAASDIEAVASSTSLRAGPADCLGGRSLFPLRPLQLSLYPLVACAHRRAALVGAFASLVDPEFTGTASPTCPSVDGLHGLESGERLRPSCPCGALMIERLTPTLSRILGEWKGSMLPR